MQIYVDADACPRPVREVILRAAQRTETMATFIANHHVPLPRSRWVQSRQVEAGFDVADRRIMELIEVGDLVITQDIPLAAEVVARGAVALNPRGTTYTRENVQAHLARRNFMEELRSGGIETRGPEAFDKATLARFANALDRFLARALRS